MKRSFSCPTGSDRRAASEMSIDIVAGAQRDFTAGFIQGPAPCSIATRCRVGIRPEIIGVA